MASFVRASVYYRNILRNALPIIRHYKSRQCIQPATIIIQHAGRLNSFLRCLSTETVQKKELQDVDTNFAISPHKKLDRALYRLDMDVRRTGRISSRDVEEIFNEFKSIGNPTSTQSLLLIRCCGSLLPEELMETRNKLVDKIWNTLQAQGVSFDVSHYNAILKVYLENEHVFSPVDFLANMQSKNVEPNRVTYQRLISHYCQKGDIAGASKILEFMKEKDLPINENVFNALIQGHSRANDMANAKSILEVMRNAKLEPSSDTYSKLLCGYAEKGDFQNIQATILEAEKNDIFLQDSDYLEIIYTLAINGFPQYVDELIPKLRKSMGYNQDAVNFILELVNRNQEDVGYKLLLSMPRSNTTSGDPVPIGQFFIRHMVKRGKPKEKILHFCGDLRKRGLNLAGVSRATEVSLASGKSDYAEYFLKAMKEQDLAIRPHYFWPLLVTHKKNNNERAVYETLELMVKLDAMANFDTFLDYAFPAINTQDPIAVVQNIKDLGYSVGAVVGPLVTYLVVQGNLNAAVELIKTFPVRLTANSLINPLAHAFHHSGDLNSMLEILVKVNANRESNQRTDWTGQFLLEYVLISDQKLDTLQQLLQKLQSKKLGISRAAADSVQLRFKDQMSEAVLALLDELTSTSFEGFTEGVDYSTHMPNPKEMNIEELENHLVELKAKNMNTRGLLRRLLFQHCRFKNLERAMQIKNEMDTLEFVYTPAMYAQLMDLHVAHNLLSDALEFRDKLLSLDPEFQIDDHKIINLASLMVKQDRSEDALKLISEFHHKHGVNEKPELLVNNNWRLLNAMAEKGDVGGTKRFFDTLHDFGFLVPVNQLLGPLVKVHIVRDDLPGALAAFENCCKSYHATPWKNELFLRLIKLEDAERLQKVVDLSSEVHGEMNTMYDLAVAFIEGGQFRQARKIFETPGFRARHNRLDSICERFLTDDKIKEMEQLVTITRDLFDVDRDRMYHHLIRAYAKSGDTTKALGVWTNMQEENVQASDHTLNFLGTFLHKNGCQVPFAIPNYHGSRQNVPGNQFDTLVKNSDVEAALSLKRSYDGEGRPISILQYSTLIDLLVRKDRVNEAVGIVKEMFEKDIYPHGSTMRILMWKLSEAGDVDTLNYVDGRLPENAKRMIGFNNYKSNAYVNSGRHLEFLEILEKGCPENRTSVPNAGILHLLNTHPDLFERVENLAKRYAESDWHTPLNMIWAHYFIKGNYDKADELYKSIPRFQENFLFTSVIKEARISQNEEMMRKLVNVLNSSNMKLRPKGIAYSALIDIQCAKGDIDAALQTYNDGLSLGLTHSDFNRQALLGLKNNLIRTGKAVPFHLTSQGNAASSSSSDSDSSDDEHKDR